MFKFAQNESTASRRRIFFYAVDATDGYTAVTTGLGVGGSTTVEIFKNGVVPGSTPISPTFTHVSRGLWFYEMIVGHLDTVGVLNVTISDALIRTLQLVGYVYAGDPLASSSISAADVWTYGTRDLTGSVAVASIANNAITAASINADAITAAKIADSAITIRLSSDATASEARLIAGTTASDVWNASLASYNAGSSFGQRILRSSNAQSECDVTASGHISAEVYGLQNAVITAASIASNAITSAKIADASLTAAKFGDSALVIGSGAAGGVKAYLGAGSITAGVVATGAIDADAIASDAITAAKIATGAIDADAIAADAITATVLSTDAVTEIVNGVWSRDPSDALFNGLAGYWLYQAGLNSQAIVSDTNTIAGTLYVESIADALLNRNVGGGSNSGRLVKEALYALRNKSEIVGTTLSVYDAVDALSWTATVASSASADPVTGIDP
jgi:hypothetical protein